MTATVPQSTPAKIIAGDTLKFTRSFPDYLPADSWVLSFALVKDSVQITFSSSDNGDGTHLINIDEATTAAYTAGEYRYRARVTNGTDVFTVETGRVEVVADYVTATGGLDDREHVKKVLDALEATILGKASKDQSSYSIANRSISRMSPNELIEWRNTYKAEYARMLEDDLVSQGKSSGRKIRVTF